MNWNAHVWIKCDNKHKLNGDWSWVSDLGKVNRAWSTMGDWDVCLEVDVASPEELEDFVWQKLRKQEWISDTHSTWFKEVWQS